MRTWLPTCTFRRKKLWVYSWWSGCSSHMHSSWTKKTVMGPTAANTMIHQLASLSSLKPYKVLLDIHQVWVPNSHHHQRIASKLVNTAWWSWSRRWGLLVLPRVDWGLPRAMWGQRGLWFMLFIGGNTAALVQAFFVLASFYIYALFTT